MDYAEALDNQYFFNPPWYPFEMTGDISHHPGVYIHFNSSTQLLRTVVYNLVQ